MLEYRFYAVADGRMASELALVHSMAIAGAPAVEGGPPAHEETLWERYGVPKPLGSWMVVAGRQAPGFLYIIKWASLAQRDERFPRFWADPFWRAQRAELTDGMTLVNSIENWLLDASPAWAAVREDDGGGPVSGIHELRVQNVLNGSQTEAADVFAKVDLPVARRHGARVLGVMEVVIGPERPRFVTLLAWPDLETQQKAAFAIDRDPEIVAQRARERTSAGGRLFLTLDQYLLEPLPWNTPEPNLGIKP